MPWTWNAGGLSGYLSSWYVTMKQSPWCMQLCSGKEGRLIVIRHWQVAFLMFGLSVKDSGTSSHYVMMGAMASQITSLAIVYPTVYSGADQRKHQSSASVAFVWGIHRGPVNSPHKWPVTRKMFPFDDVIMHMKYFKHIMFHYSFQGVHFCVILCFT